MREGLDVRAIGEGFRDSRRHLELIVHPSPGESELGAELAQLAGELQDGSHGRVVARSGDGRGVAATPALTAVADGRQVISYLALPAGPEAGPFAEILTALAQGTPGPDGQAGTREADSPAELMVFIASACPHCPQAVRAASSVVLASEGVAATIVDAQLFPELAARYAVQSVPTTIIDGGVALVGVVSADEISREIALRGTVEHESRVFESRVEGGRHEEAARQVVEGSGGGHFTALWRRSATSQRIGLMLVAEEVLARDPASMDSLVADLTDVLDSDDAALRGDTADLLGQIGHADAIAPLMALVEDPIPDLAEIAREALEQIRERERD